MNSGFGVVPYRDPNDPVQWCVQLVEHGDAGAKVVRVYIWHPDSPLSQVRDQIGSDFSLDTAVLVGLEEELRQGLANRWLDVRLTQVAKGVLMCLVDRDPASSEMAGFLYDRQVGEFVVSTADEACTQMRTLAPSMCWTDDQIEVLAGKIHDNFAKLSAG